MFSKEKLVRSVDNVNVIEMKMEIGESIGN